MTVAYDGTDFRGLAPNPGVRTVVGEMVAKLEPYVGYRPDIVMSGRTDAGVHATGQVVSFDLPVELAVPGRLQKLLNIGLGPEIVVRDVELVDSDFSARFSATSRRYQYLILNRSVPEPLLARTSWWVPEPLELDVMRLACDPLIGEHDFSSFCRRPKGATVEPSLVRRVDEASWRLIGPGLLRFEILGSAFCHQMVRSIVGFHMAVGRGKRTAGQLREVLAARDRNRAESPAPPHGLVLVETSYGQPWSDAVATGSV